MYIGHQILSLSTNRSCGVRVFHLFELLLPISMLFWYDALVFPVDLHFLLPFSSNSRGNLKNAAKIRPNTDWWNRDQGRLVGYLSADLGSQCLSPPTYKSHSWQIQMRESLSVFLTKVDNFLCAVRVYPLYMNWLHRHKWKNLGRGVIHHYYTLL